MNLLKWKELARRKTELGNKINHVHDLITQHKIGQQTSQESFSKVFKPVTSKLDDLIDSNLDSRRLPRKKQLLKKKEVGIDYMPEVDPYEDMDVEGLIDFGDYVPPQQEKQLVPKPPTYEQSLEDILEGKKDIYVDPQYFPQDPQELPPEYHDDEGVDYVIPDEDMSNEILNDIGIPNYENVDMVLDQPEMTNQKTKAYLKKIIKDATFKKNQLKGFKANITKEYNKGNISEAERQEKNQRIYNASVNLKQYISHYDTKGPFTWKEDDPSARIILESSFGLHAKTRLLGSTLNLVYMKFTCKILCSARLQSKMAGEKDKKLVLGVLPYLLALITAFQHQFAIVYNLIFHSKIQ